MITEVDIRKCWVLEAKESVPRKWKSTYLVLGKSSKRRSVNVLYLVTFKSLGDLGE